MKYTCQTQTNTLIKNTKPVDEYLNFLKQVNSKRNYVYPESSINLPFDNNIIEHCKQIAQKHKKIDTLLLIGIGGSNLGTKAIYEALDFYTKEIGKDIVFLDSVDNNQLFKLTNYKAKFNPQKTATVVVSKSGHTTETIVNTEILLSLYPKLQENLIVISNKESKLFKQAEQKGLTVAEIPEKVGGRFSLFSPVGLIPLEILDINTSLIVKGAKKAVLNSLVSEINENIAKQSALSIYNAIQNDKLILDFFTFNKELENLGKWYRQLVAESLGKQGKGITPTVSVGSIDLHSIAQLYLGGPNNFYTSFIFGKQNVGVTNFNQQLKELEKTTTEVREPVVPKTTYFDHLVENIQEKTPTQIRDAVYKGVIKAYTNKGIQYDQYEAPEINEEFLGEFMQTAMIQVMFLGHLLNVTTFNQPNVEDYKKETRQILALN